MNNYIIKEVEKLIKAYDTNDPFVIAKNLGISIWYKDLGKLKGFYQRHGRNRYIILNKDLSSNEMRLVCAHELGHDILHKEFATALFDEQSMFGSNSKHEYEANIFSSELLLDDNKVLETIFLHDDVFKAAKVLNINKNILTLKIKGLINKGYEFNNPCSYNSNFLKK